MTHSLSLGGGELYLQELLLRLRADHDIDLMVISPGDGPLRAGLEAAGIRVHICAPPVLLPGRYESQVVEMGCLLLMWGCDVVIANTAGMFTFVDAAMWAERPVIWAIHESFRLEVFEHLNWGHLHPALSARWRSCLRDGAHVVFEAEATKALYEHQVPGMQASCVRYGIDLTAIEDYERTHDRGALRADLGFGPDDFVLLCMGIFQERKQQLALVHAFSAFVDAYPRATLVLMGNHPSPYADAVRRQVDMFGMAERVMIVDIDPDTYRYYQCADVLVSASDTESLPRSVLEAMAFGVPVLAADVFGVTEVVQDGVHGWVCESGSGVSLLAGFRRALTTPEDERSAMSARCREAAVGFSGEGYAAHYASLIYSSFSPVDVGEVGCGAARGIG
jgi:glycosyltransferase involved in cell wall biosynthesis